MDKLADAIGEGIAGRAAGFDADIAAAAEGGFRLTVDDFDVYGTADGDGLAVDDADRVCGRLIGMRRGGGEERGAKKRGSQNRHDGAAKAGKRIGIGCHSVALLVTPREALSYTIRMLRDGRTCDRLNRRRRYR